MSYTDAQMNHVAFVQWLFSAQEDNNAELKHCRNAVVIAVGEYLSVTQRTYLLHYFVDNLTVTEIAEMCGRNKSSVSRGINAALKKLYMCLRFATPKLLKCDEIYTDLRNRRTYYGL